MAIAEEDHDIVCQSGTSLQAINQRLAEEETSLALPVSLLPILNHSLSDHLIQIDASNEEVRA